MQIREKEGLDPSEMSNSMRQFQHTIRLRSDVANESITAKVQRRTIIPNGFSVQCLMEKAAMRFPIKGTDYVLEISRYDVYRPRPTKQARKAAPAAGMEFKEASTFWEAVILGQNWDQDMINMCKSADDHINLDAAFDQFFKRRQNETQRAAFERFVQIVTDVGGLWDQADHDHTEPVSSLGMDTSSVGTATEGKLIDLD